MWHAPIALRFYRRRRWLIVSGVNMRRFLFFPFLFGFIFASSAYAQTVEIELFTLAEDASQHRVTKFFRATEKPVKLQGVPTGWSCEVVVPKWSGVSYESSTSAIRCSPSMSPPNSVLVGITITCRKIDMEKNEKNFVLMGAGNHFVTVTIGCWS